MSHTERSLLYKSMSLLYCRMEIMIQSYAPLFQDRLYEIDRTWKNNLVFSGIKTDGGCNSSGAVFESPGNKMGEDLCRVDHYNLIYH